ncbi:MAG: hypothetical protein NPIRA05_08020 [Nitrospirales bacterium]|nr:MAG: hypothetical protein NPIRA05_08020 [Nitrospirales bacterium]
MTSKTYLRHVFLYVFVTTFSFVGINFTLNDFGLFRDRDAIRIWTEEKTSKYLFSYEYIPKNFEGVLIGPSVSANVDTKNIQHFKIYNLSMVSANISELKFALDNVLPSGRIKYLIICLYPYLTKDSGRKGRQIDEKEYWGSLFSLLPLKLLYGKINSIVRPELDVFHSSEWGFNDINLHTKHIIFREIVEQHRKEPGGTIRIDPVAYAELQSVLQLAHEHKVQVLAYYFPLYVEFLRAYEKTGTWDLYQGKINRLFDSSDLVWDMNQPEFAYITDEYTSYSDGHLSSRGAHLVAQVIEQKLSALTLSEDSTEK